MYYLGIIFYQKGWDHNNIPCYYVRRSSLWISVESLANFIDDINKTLESNSWVLESQNTTLIHYLPNWDFSRYFMDPGKKFWGFLIGCFALVGSSAHSTFWDYCYLQERIFLLCLSNTYLKMVCLLSCIFWVAFWSWVFYLSDFKDWGYLRKSTSTDSRLHFWWNSKEKVLARPECQKTVKWFSLSGENWKKGIIDPRKCSCWWKCWQMSLAWCRCHEKSVNIRRTALYTSGIWSALSHVNKPFKNVKWFQ